MRGDGYQLLQCNAPANPAHVRTYAPFERGWLPEKVQLLASGVTIVRTYAPFERGWLPYSVGFLYLETPGQDLRPV